MLRQSLVATAAMLALNSHNCPAAEPVFESAWTRIPVGSVDLMQRAQNALLQYARGCAANDATGSNSLTDDAVIEYATSKTGQFLAEDAAYLGVCWEGATEMNRAADSHIRLYPTSYPNSVFVQFETVDGRGAAHEHLSIIEIDGQRIARIRDLTTSR